MKRTLCTMKTKLIILLLTSTLTAGAQMYFGTKKEVPDSVFNALAQTPPMGWNKLEQIRMQCERTAHQRNGRCHDCHRHEGCRL